jgi:hypothetical protein
MSEDDDFKAFLHIVHVSDIHCLDGGSPTDLRAERYMESVIEQLRGFSQRLADFVQNLWEQGLAGHDPDAHDRFCEFLKWFAAEPEFGGIETWLLDTGDLSSMGDMSSLNTALGWLRRYHHLLGASQALVLYGNHDAWPGKFPFGCSLTELDAHRNAIRAGVFPPAWPQGPLGIPIPHTESRVLLHGVNSAIDDRWHNSFARGHVGLDPNWRPLGLLTDQLARVAIEVEQGFHPDGRTRDFRILAVHHPVHYPPPRPARTMSLGNDDEVADALIRFDQKHRGKLAQLVLSGHTHETYPRLGELPPNAVGQSYKPLVAGQMQLIAGSLAQMPRAVDRAACRGDAFVPHQCQILTFFASPANAERLLLIERRVVGRPGGTGDFGILTAAQPSPPVESMRIEY